MQAGASDAGTAALDLGDVPVAVRRIRSALGLSQEQFAHRLGVSFATVNRWERGHAEPSPRSREVLARLRVEITAPAAAAVTDPLPPDRSPFVGRERELAELGTLWPPTRLVTLTGPGGIGKTRLAVELLRRSEVDGQRLVVVALDLVSEPALVASVIGAALGLPAGPGPGRPIGPSGIDGATAGTADAVTAGLAAGMADMVVDALRGLPGVLLLDGAGQVAEPVRALLDRVFAAGAAVRVLATSRQPLGVAGEQVWRVPPLRLPDPGLPRAEAEQADAVKLLVTRARDRAAPLPGGDAGWRDLVALCRRLDGLPVALELAAGWMSTLTPGQLLGRLGGPEPTIGRSAVEWSAALLTGPDRDLAGQLSVLIGPFTVDDVLAVAGPGADRLGSIRRLAEASWLEPLPDDLDSEPSRWLRMPDPLRDWARSTMDGAAGAAARGRLVERVRALARPLDGGPDGPGLAGAADPGWPRQLERRAGTVQAALAILASTTGAAGTAGAAGAAGGAAGRGSGGEAGGGGADVGGGAGDSAGRVGAEIAVGLLPWWQRSGRAAEGRHWLAVFAGRVGGVLRARAWCAAACLALPVDPDAADRLARDALEALDGVDPRWAGRARTVTSSAARQRGDLDTARAELAAALALHRAAGDPAEVALTLAGLGVLAVASDDLPAAEAHYAESLDLKRRLGDDRSTAATLTSLADVHRRQLRPEQALAVLEQARTVAVRTGDQSLQSRVDTSLGEMLLELGRPQAAGDAFRLALETAQLLGSRPGEVQALCGIGRALLAGGRRGRAVRILQESLALATSLGDAGLLAEVRSALAALGGEPAPPRPPGGLSARQAEVLGWLAAGLSDKDIARRLGITASTVQRHVANVYQKLGVRNRVEAAQFAFIHGIGQRPPPPGPPR